MQCCSSSSQPVFVSVPVFVSMPGRQLLLLLESCGCLLCYAADWWFRPDLLLCRVGPYAICQAWVAAPCTQLLIIAMTCMHPASHDAAQCMPPQGEHALQPGTCGPTVCLGRLLGPPWDSLALLHGVLHVASLCISVLAVIASLALHDAVCMSPRGSGTSARNLWTCRLPGPAAGSPLGCIA